jgi:type II secretory pathway pseudopilin PulG
MRVDRHGLTMIELLVSIGIVTLLLGLLIPAVLKGRDAARSTQCQNNLHQLALGFRLFADAHHDRLPDTTNVPWSVQIAPFLEMSEDTFRCPADPGGAEMGYHWRDDSILLPSSALSGKKIDLVAKSDLALVFDQISSRHGRGTLNVAFVNGAVKVLDEDEFEKNLMLAVDSGGFPKLRPKDFENLP